jgi:hypothetical protein
LPPLYCYDLAALFGYCVTLHPFMAYLQLHCTGGLSCRFIVRLPVVFCYH